MLFIRQWIFGVELWICGHVTLGLKHDEKKRSQFIRNGMPTCWGDLSVEMIFDSLPKHMIKET